MVGIIQICPAPCGLAQHHVVTSLPPHKASPINWEDLGRMAGFHVWTVVNFYTNSGRKLVHSEIQITDHTPKNVRYKGGASDLKCLSNGAAGTCILSAAARFLPVEQLLAGTGRDM